MLHRYRLRTRQIAVSLSFGLATVGWLPVAPAAAQDCWMRRDR